jgi:hypothetical protein
LNKFELLRRKVFGFVTNEAVDMIGREREREGWGDAAAKLKSKLKKFKGNTSLLVFTLFFVKKRCVQRVGK